MKNIKAIIFDAYGTLFDVNSAAEKCKDKIGDKWEGFANYWRTTQLEYTWLRSLMNRHKDFWQVTEDSLDKSMKAFKIDSLMRNELLDLYKKLSTFPEVKEVLSNLKEKDYKLAILSNGTPTLLNELVTNNNLDKKADNERQSYRGANDGDSCSSADVGHTKRKSEKAAEKAKAEAQAAADSVGTPP